MAVVIYLMQKHFYNELQVGLQEGRRVKGVKNLCSCNPWLGNMFLKGVSMPWKRIPEAQFQLISAQLATANEQGDCQ